MSLYFLLMKLKTISRLALRQAVYLCIVICVLVLMLPAATSCGGTTEKTNSFLELLGLVPVIDSSNQTPAYYTLIDFAAAYQADGITLTNPEELFQNFEEDNVSYNLFGMGSFITGYGRWAYPPTITKDKLGYDVTSIDAEIQFGYPPAEGVAAIGRFNPQATKDVLSNQQSWPDDVKARYATEVYNAVTIFSWGDGLKTDLINRLASPHLDELGRAKPLAITDKYLFYTPSVETIKQMIDASQKQHNSLADLPEYASLANGLAKYKVFAAVIGDAALANQYFAQYDSANFTEEQKAAFQKTLDKNAGTLLKKYLTFATGFGKDDKGIYNVIVLYHGNASDAQENVALLRQHFDTAYSDYFSEMWSGIIYSMDVSAEGNTLVAKIYSSAPSLWSSWLFDRNNLLTYEE